MKQCNLIQIKMKPNKYQYQPPPGTSKRLV
jgi:hypothetical protein